MTQETECQEKICENCEEVITEGYCQINDSITCSKCLDAPKCLRCFRPVIFKKVWDHHAECIEARLAVLLTDDGNRNIFFNIYGENQ